MRNVKESAERLVNADAVLVGAGSGLSAAAGFTYEGRRFEEHFGDFIEKYGMRDMYSAGFYPFPTQEEKWAYWSRHIYYNRYDQAARQPYLDLYELIKDKDYFVLTTNVDHQFWLAGFQDERIFATQGDYGLFQCARACHDTLYQNEAQVREMLSRQKECRIPSELIPRCPVCGGAVEVNLRCDESFVQDRKFYQAAARYESFLTRVEDRRIVLLELGVGMNTPGIIKYPFWQMTKKWKNSFYICINQGQAWAPPELKARSLCIDQDIKEALEEWRREALNDRA